MANMCYNISNRRFHQLPVAVACATAVGVI